MQAITPPFQVTIADNLMTIRHFHNSHTQMLGLIDLNKPCHFALDGQRIACLTSLGHLQIQAPAGTDAAALLECIGSATTQYEQGKLSGSEKALFHITAAWQAMITTVFGRTLLVCGTLLMLVVGASSTNETDNLRRRAIDVPDAQSSAPASIQPPQVAIGPPVVEEAPADFVHTLQTEAVGKTTETAALPGDGWALPESVHTVLPTNLQMAAQRKLFTIEYSTGHAHTLYVFADPECPNCQRLEPALEAAAKDFNVVVFPVAVIGREKSIASITPVLCLPPEQRKAAWSDLFDVGHGVMDMGKAKESAAVEPGHCDIAGKALGVNEVAYQTYRIPGTPWAIADDGRHVSQEVLQNPLKLQAFMGAAGVSHAAQ
jgi:TrbB protein